MTTKVLRISIWVNRKVETSECFFLARVNCRAKKQLAFCDQLSPVSVNDLNLNEVLVILYLQKTHFDLIA